jgi:hypothetical protein
LGRSHLGTQTDPNWEARVQGQLFENTLIMKPKLRGGSMDGAFVALRPTPRPPALGGQNAITNAGKQRV